MTDIFKNVENSVRAVVDPCFLASPDVSGGHYAGMNATFEPHVKAAMNHYKDVTPGYRGPSVQLYESRPGPSRYQDLVGPRTPRDLLVGLGPRTPSDVDSKATPGPATVARPAGCGRAGPRDSRVYNLLHLYWCREAGKPQVYTETCPVCSFAVLPRKGYRCTECGMKPLHEGFCQEDHVCRSSLDDLS